MPTRKLALFVLGLAAFVVVFIACLPARVLAFWLPSPVQVGLLTGSVWNGGTDYLAIDGRPLGAARWKVGPLHLLRGRLALDADVSGVGELHGWVALAPGNSLEARNIELRWPLSALPVPLQAIPPGWTGTLQATLRELSLDDGAIRSINGVVDARNLRKGPPENLSLGSFRLVFDENSVQGERLVGRLQDLDGPLQVSGTLVLGLDRSYQIDVQVAARPNAPKSLVDGLRFLGTPDAEGRRPFSASGSY